MRLPILAILFVACALPAAPVPKKETAVEGAWVEHREFGGDLTITFTAGRLVFDDGKSPAEAGSYKLDTTKDPPWIDFVTPARANPTNGKPPLLGVYKIHGDKLTLYLAEKERPAKCEVPGGSKVMRFTLTRAKKK